MLVVVILTTVQSTFDAAPSTMRGMSYQLKHNIEETEVSRMSSSISVSPTTPFRYTFLFKRKSWS